MIKIELAKKEQATIIASLIMEAMNYDCCQWFIGLENTLDSFHKLLSRLVENDNSLYSYHNTLVAVNEDGDVVGICVCYDGAKVKELRKSFEIEMLQTYEKDYSHLPYETKAGEFYIDSLCVHQEWRKKGIASQLLNAAKEKANGLHLPASLLVDTSNSKAEALYIRLGFKYDSKTKWGGHSMKRLIYVNGEK